MSIDITEQAAFVRGVLERSDLIARITGEPAAEYPAMVLRAILATLERVAAEERPERMQ